MNGGLIEFTHRIAQTLHRMGLAGAAIDLDRFHKLGKSWIREAAKKEDLLVRAAMKAGMKQFRPTNDGDIRELLFERLGLPVNFKTDKGGLPAVHKVALKQFIDNEAANLLLEFNAVDKLASTWYGKENKNANPIRLPPVKDLIKSIPGNSDLGLLHFWINMLGTRTARRSSGGKQEDEGNMRVGRNAQNWSPKARQVVRSRWKRGRIAACDFKSLEPVLYGWIARDEKLLEFFYEGEGYIDIAREVFKKKVVKDDKFYKLIKNNVLGLFYNEKEYKLAREFWDKLQIRLAPDFDSHLVKVTRIRKRVLRLFPGLRRYVREREREVLTTRQVVTPIGRIRHLPHHGPGSKMLWKKINQGINAPVQSTASECTGSAMVDFEEVLLKEHGLSYIEWHKALLEVPWDPPCSVLFNELHDELDLDMHPFTGKRDLELLVESMRSVKSFKKLVPGFNLKLRVDVGVGETWK